MAFSFSSIISKLPFYQRLKNGTHRYLYLDSSASWDTLQDKLKCGYENPVLLPILQLIAFYTSKVEFKIRDVKTRKLSGFKVYADDLQGRDCLVVDDICDGGGTFLGLAKELKAKNAGKLYLAVSHGIFSRGVERLLEHYDGVFSTNSFGEVEGLEQFEIKN